MLCQQGGEDKAPKWTFSGTGSRPVGDSLNTNVPYHVIAPKDPQHRYTKDPAYSFGNNRPSSAPALRGPPPGFDMTNHKLRPNTPQFSFGTTKRPSPFPGEDGPGPGFKVPKGRDGPKYSMPGRRGPKTPADTGPGPNFCRKERPTGRPRPASAPTRSRRERPQSAGAGPGPTYYRPGMERDTGGVSIGDLRKEKATLYGGGDEDDVRRLGKPWGYFGYNDFGHTEGYEPPEGEWKTDKCGRSGPRCLSRT